MNIFFHFLKLHGAFMAYFRNCKKERGNSPKKVVQMLKVLRPKNYISSAFNWSDSKEGSIYWIDIYEKWVNFCKENNLEQIEDLENPVEKKTDFENPW